MLARHRTVFYNARTLKFNPDIYSSVSSMVPDDRIISHQKRHLTRASKFHPRLNSVQFGSMIWTLTPDAGWKTEREDVSLVNYGFRSWICSSPYCVYYEDTNESDEETE